MELVYHIVVPCLTTLGTIAIVYFVWFKGRLDKAVERTDPFALEVFRAQLRVYTDLVDALGEVDDATVMQVSAQILSGRTQGYKQGQWMQTAAHHAQLRSSGLAEVYRQVRRASYLLGADVPAAAEAYIDALDEVLEQSEPNFRPANEAGEEFLRVVRAALNIAALDNRIRARMLDEDRARISVG